MEVHTFVDMFCGEACEESVRWLESLAYDMDVQEAWELCDRGDWMLWLICEHIKYSYGEIPAYRLEYLEPVLLWNLGAGNMGEVKDWERFSDLGRFGALLTIVHRYIYDEGDNIRAPYVLDVLEDLSHEIRRHYPEPLIPVY